MKTGKTALATIDRLNAIIDRIEAVDGGPGIMADLLDHLREAEGARIVQSGGIWHVSMHGIRARALASSTLALMGWAGQARDRIAAAGEAA